MQPNKLLMNCPACGHQVSKKAACCPECGHRISFAMAMFSAVFWGILLAGAFGGFVVGMFQAIDTMSRIH
jgi:DNA-directed RNA polymerase subunit RPC12/RpoP